eukprot:TRINITY_DN326_c0_g1_i10.p5 TRINITY_DN326_c0_g1~~TRINITY_DN326_c0_g1_i10.p5  ORF type:complete len:117 (-),score=34.27 TRINITY_DN326_c0_g1_i10:1950-2300(-)
MKLCKGAHENSYFQEQFFLADNFYWKNVEGLRASSFSVMRDDQLTDSEVGLLLQMRRNPFSFEYAVGGGDVLDPLVVESFMSSFGYDMQMKDDIIKSATDHVKDYVRDVFFCDSEF